MSQFPPGPLWTAMLTPVALPPTDPNVRVRDVARLTGQNAAVLARLQQGPATNAELAGIALKYTSRISDLRKAGFVIVEKDGTYTLAAAKEQTE